MTDLNRSLGNLAVLIVDDGPDNISVLRNILQTEGYQIYVATSGEVALKIAGQIRPDLILLDVMMPGMDGFETCKRLKANTDTKDIPVIFVTARIDTQDIVEGFHMGGVDYINKPVRQEEVCARVRTQLQLRNHVQVERERTEQLRAIVNNMAEGLFIVESNGRIQFANPACNHLLGFEGDDLLGRSIAELLTESVSREYLEYLSANAIVDTHKTVLQHGPREVVIRRCNGETISLDLTVTPLFLKRPLYIGLLHDISSHKKSADELQRAAYIDPLTNIPNRRHFDKFLKAEWHRAQRNGLPLSLGLLDVDYFKPYNDALGHQAGDRCLQQVALAIQTHAQRPTDMVARYGGEEFVLLFAETEVESAVGLIESVRTHVESLQLSHPCSTVSSWVTVSIGVATIRPAIGLEIDRLFAMADEALYRAKEKGRNRIETARMSTI